MVERPILFSALMVLALLAGRKTQTRRLAWAYPDMKKNPQGTIRLEELRAQGIPGAEARRCLPPSIWQKAQPGDTIWVREALCARNMDIGGMLGFTEPLTEVDMTRGDLACSYEADGTEIVEEAGFDLAWLWKKPRLPAMFMPRSFSRITLEVTAVRVEPLQDITEEDAAAEGIASYVPDSVIQQGPRWYRNRYEDLWNSLHGPGAWEKNPAVVVISFKKGEP